MVQIVEAKIPDLKIIQNIAYNTWPSTFGGILSASQIKYMLDMMYSMDALIHQVKEKHHKFVLAKEGKEFLGFLSYEVNLEAATKTKIHKIYILPTAQGKGVGKSLIQTAIEAALKAGNAYLFLNVNKYNTGAIDFYRKLGFSEIRKEEIAIGNGFLMEDVVMELNL